MTNVAKEIIDSLIEDDSLPDCTLSDDNKSYSMEWAFGNVGSKRLFIDINAEDGTIQVVWKTRSRFHHFQIDAKEEV